MATNNTRPGKWGPNGEKLGDGEFWSSSKQAFVYRYTDELGKSHDITRKSLQKLRQVEGELAESVRKGLRPEESRVTVADMVDRWREERLAHVRAGSIKRATLYQYEFFLEDYVLPRIGNRRVVDITRDDYRALMRELYEKGSKSRTGVISKDKRLSRSSVDIINTACRQIFEKAIDSRIIATNPTEGAMTYMTRLYGTEAPAKKREVIALTEDQEEALLDWVYNSPVYHHWWPILVTQVKTGMRIGEVMGLRDCDIDGDFIDVNHTLTYIDARKRTGNTPAHYEVHAPKTKAGYRRIPIMDVVHEALDEALATRADSQFTVDGYTGFIFTDAKGRPYKNYLINNALLRITRDYNAELLNGDLETAGLLPTFSSHSLRHTFATRCVEVGKEPMALKTIMGHENIATTMNIYAEAQPSFTSDEMAKLEKRRKSKKSQGKSKH